MSIKKFLFTSNSSEKLLYDVNLIRKKKLQIFFVKKTVIKNSLKFLIQK